MKQNLLIFSMGLVTLLVSHCNATEPIVKSDALYQAVNDNNLEFVNQLLARPDRQRFLEWESLDLIYPTALFVSIGKCKNLKITELLVKAGADVLLQNHVAESPLKMAFSQGGTLADIASMISTIINNVPQEKCLRLWPTFSKGLAEDPMLGSCSNGSRSLMLHYLRRANGSSFHDSLYVFVPGQVYIENINHIFPMLNEYHDLNRKKLEIILKHVYRDKALTQSAFLPDMCKYIAQQGYGAPDVFDEKYKSLLEEKHLLFEKWVSYFNRN